MTKKQQKIILRHHALLRFIINLAKPKSMNTKLLIILGEHGVHAVFVVPPLMTPITE